MANNFVHDASAAPLLYRGYQTLDCRDGGGPWGRRRAFDQAQARTDGAGTTLSASDIRENEERYFRVL